MRKCKHDANSVNSLSHRRLLSHNHVYFSSPINSWCESVGKGSTAKLRTEKTGLYRQRHCSFPVLNLAALTSVPTSPHTSFSSIFGLRPCFEFLSLFQREKNGSSSRFLQAVENNLKGPGVLQATEK